MKSLMSHVAVGLVTLLVAVLVLGDHRLPARSAGPARVAAPRGLPRDVPEPEPLPEDLLRAVEADEAVNIRVYETSNRGVVNIDTAAVRAGLFDDVVQRGSGSGFVIDTDGHILTNFHVVADARRLDVTFFDGSAHPARIVGVDPNNDLAVIRVEVPPEDLHPLPLGESAGLRVGRKVLALGNPFGLERTLTTGIVSSLDRTMKARNGRIIKGIIQTDAAINPGNSGGPLLDTQGRVVGVTTAIVGEVGQSAGIGFAIPINTIKRILEPLIKNGRVIRADLGIVEVFTTDDGIYIIELESGGPADRAGLKPIEVVVERFGRFSRTRPDPDSADRIVAVDGQPVRTVEELLSEVEKHQPGDQAVVTVVRQGRQRDVTVTLGATD